MQLADVGRNEPCPCGSNRKFKKCCLAAQTVAAAGAPNDLDLDALVERAIERDDWAPVQAVFDGGFTLFEPCAPLEYVRFRDDLISPTADPSRLCSAGWMRWCEREIGDVLGRFDLAPEERDGLRLAVHMLRRFGAQSPLVEELARLQLAERGVRVRKFRDAMSRLGLSVEEIAGNGLETLDWITRDGPQVLLFADWFALRASTDELGEQLWLSGIASRVCDLHLAALAQPDRPYPKERLQLVGTALLCLLPRIGSALAQFTAPLMTTDDERTLYDALTAGRADGALPGIVGRIIAATEGRGDYAGAALLRHARQRVQALHR